MASQNGILLASARWTIVKEEQQLCLDINGKSDVTVELAYLAQGGANIVFTMGVTPDNTGDTVHASVHKKVLRVRKSDMLAGQKDTFTPREICRFVNDEMQPILNPWVMPHSLVGLTPSLRGQLVAALPAIVDGRRFIESAAETAQSKSGALDGSAATVVHALLLPDMRSSHDSLSLLLEVKPKWLVQSPTAPQGARRCRTCAKQASEGKDRTTQHCPLALLSGQKALIAPIIDDLCDAKGVADLEARRTLTEFFVTGNEGNMILRRLASLQHQFDPKGILVCEQDESSLRQVSMAMTLRDCSLYLTIHHPTPEATLIGSSAIGLYPSPTGIDTIAQPQASKSSRLLPGELPHNSDMPTESILKATTDSSVPKVPLMMPEHKKLSITPTLADLDPKHLSKAEYWASLERRLIDNGYYSGTEKPDDQREPRHTSCMLWSSPE